MPPRKTPAPKPTREQELLADWLAKADNVVLACWDEGHWWWADADELGFSATKNGVWGVKEPCNRTVDGVRCKIKRTRFIDPVTGRIDGPSAAYDYSGNPKYRMPRSGDGYSILNKNSRAAVRLERKRRGHLGEEVR